MRQKKTTQRPGEGQGAGPNELKANAEKREGKAERTYPVLYKSLIINNLVKNEPERS